MAIWQSHLHPRDWRGRFITTGVHVRVSGGLIGTVRDVQPGELEGDPGMAEVELPDGRIGSVPTDRLTVAEPPEGHAYIADGTIASIGDIVGHTDTAGTHEIKSVNADGSITVGNPDNEDENQDVDPATLTRSDHMNVDDNPQINAIAEDGTEEPPKPGEEAPAQDDPELDDGQQLIITMSENASRIADEQNTEERHTRAAMTAEMARDEYLEAGYPEDHPKVMELDARIARHEAAAETLNSPISHTDDENATASDVDGAAIEVGSRVERVGEDGRGGVVKEIGSTGLITYVNDQGETRVVRNDEVRVSSADEELDTSFMPQAHTPEEFAAWGDRAETIATSPGPKLDKLRDGLRSNNRQALKDALHAAYNRDNGLGKDGVRVQFNNVSRARQGIKFGGALVAPDGTNIGVIEREFRYEDPDDPNRVTDVHNSYLKINKDYQGQGIAQAIYRNQEDWLIREGVPTITIEANIDVGGYAWARAGFDYKDAAEARRHISSMMQKSIGHYGPDDPTTKQLAAIKDQLDSVRDDPESEFPTPFEISNVGYTPGAKTWPGKELMLGTHWEAIKYLTPPTESEEL